MMKLHGRLIACAGLLLTSVCAAHPPESYVGRWALTLPNKTAGWLEIKQSGEGLSGALLWGGGSVKPLASVVVEGETITMIRKNRVQRDGQWQEMEEILSGSGDGQTLSLEHIVPGAGGQAETRVAFSGKKLPPLPAKPDLAAAKAGEAVSLFNGKDLSGWRLQHQGLKNGWSAKDGVLVNDAEKGVHGYGNLLTEAAFEDFKLKLEVLVPEKSNSGIYLRGMYEVQVLDSFGRAPDSHHMGGIYSRIAPSSAEERRAGVWQTMEITLLQQHVTVVLNGVTIIENQPLQGCTGGALSADPLKPGPILLQGNHGAVQYRNMVLTPLTL